MYRKLAVFLMAVLLLGCASGADKSRLKRRPTSQQLADQLGFSDDLERELQQRRHDTDYPPADIAVSDLYGRPGNLNDYRGKVVLINFFATWALPCQFEAKLLNDLYGKYKDRGLEVVGIAMDQQGELMVSPFVDSMNIKYRVYLAAGKTKEGQTPFGKVETIPVSILVDRKGKEIKGYIGPYPKNKLEKDIRRALRIFGGGN